MRQCFKIKLDGPIYPLFCNCHTVCRGGWGSVSGHGTGSIVSGFQKYRKPLDPHEPSDLNRSTPILSHIKKKSPDLYIEKMGRLRVDRNRNRYTTGKAPHKPTLLLALIILHRNGRQDLSDIRVDLDIRETWSELWKCLDYRNQVPFIFPCII